MLLEALRGTSRPQRHYLPTLDGWRALSIAAVILSHDRIHQAGPFSTRWFYDQGQIGVDIFFAISGLLICSRLLSEEDHRGRIDIAGFYIRRAFRILPPAILYLLTLAFLARLIALPVGIPEIVASLFFLHNYTITFRHFQTIYPYYTGHFWSLAVEEHFYLLLPALLFFTPKKWRVPALLALTAIVSLHRFSHGAGAKLAHTDMRLDALLVPAAMAILVRKSAIRAWLIRWLRFWSVLAIALIAAISIKYLPRVQPIELVWLTPLFVLGTMLRPRSLISRFLELAPLRYVGRLSYSIYLWQQLFFVVHYGTIAPQMGRWQQWPFCLLATFTLAMLSYYLVERPFMNLGHRIAASRLNGPTQQPNRAAAAES